MKNDKIRTEGPSKFQECKFDQVKALSNPNLSNLVYTKFH